MPIGALILYFGFVAIAIGGAYWALRALGLANDIPVTEQSARMALQDRMIANPSGAKFYAKNAILFSGEDAQIIIIHAMGHHLAVRLFVPADVKAIKQAVSAVTIELHEYDMPRIRLKTDAPSALADWLERETKSAV